MKSSLYITTKTAGFDSGNPMALKMREALGKACGFEPSDDPFEFHRQMVVAKAKAIEAEAKRNERNRKARERRAMLAAMPKCPNCKGRNVGIAEDRTHSCSDCGCQWTFKAGAAKAEAEKAAVHHSRTRFVNTSRTVELNSRPMEPVGDAIRRLQQVVQQAEEREARRQYGRWGRAKVEADAPESDYTAIRREHQTRPEATKKVGDERERLIDELVRLNAFSGEFMLAYDTHELRRALRRAKSLRGIAEKSAGASPSGEANKPIRFGGYSVGEDERERVVFTIRRLRAQLPRNHESVSLYELLNHLRNVCEKAGKKWFAELWPTAQPIATVLPKVTKTEIAPEPKAELVDPKIERLWTAIFGQLGAGC
jgi:ribosomal protein L37AE/L43A